MYFCCILENSEETSCSSLVLKVDPPEEIPENIVEDPTNSTLDHRSSDSDTHG